MKPIRSNRPERLLALRREFDESFAQPMSQDLAAQVKLLIVQAGDGHFALRLGDALGLHACPKLVSLPTARPGLLGLAGIRGQLIVVYRLAAILGVTQVPTAPRWLLLPRADEKLALGLDGILSYVNTPVAAICPVSSASGSPLQGFCPQVWSADGASRPVLDINAVVAAIRKEAAAPLPEKES
jgi:chemotaxis signal transduction protein